MITCYETIIILLLKSNLFMHMTFFRLINNISNDIVNTIFISNNKYKI